ncbi:MAG: hypothetical protein K2M44_01725, partial [Clostridia bacterium]|nr:hypothetical protein [Clostridia bacterium]
ELAGCLNNNAFNYTYTDEDGNTVSASEMVAGKNYSVKATLKDEYARNFEFVDASGMPLPDATASASHEFNYSGNNANGGDNNGGGSGNVPDDYYKWYKVHVITEIAMVAVTLIIVVLVIVLIVKSNNRRRDKRDNSDRYDRRGSNTYTDSSNTGGGYSDDIQ